MLLGLAHRFFLLPVTLKCKGECRIACDFLLNVSIGAQVLRQKILRRVGHRLLLVIHRWQAPASPFIRHGPDRYRTILES